MSTSTGGRGFPPAPGAAALGRCRGPEIVFASESWMGGGSPQALALTVALAQKNENIKTGDCHFPIFLALWPSDLVVLC